MDKLVPVPSRGMVPERDVGKLPISTSTIWASTLAACTP